MEIITSFPLSFTLLAFLVFSPSDVLTRSGSSFYPQDLPKFIPTRDSFSYTAGEVAVLECTIDNLGDKKIVWRRASDDSPLTVGKFSFVEDPRFSLEKSKGENSWNLLISDVKVSDAGLYECQVSSSIRHLRHHVMLKVTDPVPTPPTAAATKPKIMIAGSNFIDEGDRIFLECNATSKEYPPEDIDWFRSGNALSTRPNEGMFIRKHVSLNTGTIVSSMEIKHARLHDQGTYVCRTSNKDVTSIDIHILKADSNQTKRNTEKRIDGDPVYSSGTGVHRGYPEIDGRNGYYGGHGGGRTRQGGRGSQAGRGGHGSHGGRDGDNGKEALQFHPVLSLVLPIMTSVITYLLTAIREIT